MAQVASAQAANAISRDSLWWNRVGIAGVILTLLVNAWAARAAALAASSASKSAQMFRESEAAFMVPTFALSDDGSALNIRVFNRGRTNAAVIHAAIGSVSNWAKPCPFAFSKNLPATDLLIGPDASYDFGWMAFASDESSARIGGGLIYRDIFNRVHVCRVAVDVDRAGRAIRVAHQADFNEWESSARRVERGSRRSFSGKRMT